MVAIDDHRAWTLYKYPKIINYKTGEILDEIEDIDSGDQFSSIIGGADHLPPMITVDSKSKKIAIGNSNKLDILTAD